MLISSSAETNGSFTASSAASISACAASFKILRIATRDACVIAADATPDNPNVTTAVAAATAIWIASTISWMITAIFIPMISIAATSKTDAITSAACRASSRYPDPPENLSHFSTNASIDSP
ncbi:hypothetical protein ACOKM5_12425 [Streptomyces sp. BH097]|uniref:hypothetical protein n=2 Tax=unclassified Streptomyces TaxID=2593676 RepID=UPI003BB6691D